MSPVNRDKNNVPVRGSGGARYSVASSSDLSSSTTSVSRIPKLRSSESPAKHVTKQSNSDVNSEANRNIRRNSSEYFKSSFSGQLSSEDHEPRTFIVETLSDQREVTDEEAVKNEDDDVDRKLLEHNDVDNETIPTMYQSTVQQVLTPYICPAVNDSGQELHHLIQRSNEYITLNIKSDSETSDKKCSVLNVSQENKHKYVEKTASEHCDTPEPVYECFTQGK